MLPIDEHAKSGAWVYVKWDDHPILPKMPVLTKWVNEYKGWLYPATASSIILIDPVGYLPASWVENVGKMREALLSVSQCIYLNDYVEPTLTTDFDQGKLDEALYATEWPKQGREA